MFKYTIGGMRNCPVCNDMIILCYRWYEELACLEVDDAIQRRLENGDPVTLPIGKLLERLLVFKQLNNQRTDGQPMAKFYRDLLKIAEDRLKQIK
jgi:hypothetical protein